MSVIPNTYVKYNSYIADANGDHRKVSTWTHADTVEMPDGSVLSDLNVSDNKVAQTPTTTGINNVLLSNGYGNYSETAGAKKAVNLSFNNATNELKVGTDQNALLVRNNDILFEGNTWDGTHTSLKDAIAAADASGYTELVGTLTAGSTTLTLQNVAITTTATYDFFTDAFGVSPTNIQVTNGELVLTFEAQQSDVSVKVRVS